jgi:hypothetical protein
MSNEKISDNFIDSNYVRFFAAFLNDIWIYGPISYTNFDNEIIGFSELSKRIEAELRYTSPYFEESEEGKIPFIYMLYREGIFEILNEEIYQTEISNPKICIVLTQDEKKGKELFNYFLKTEAGSNFINFSKTQDKKII